MSLTLARLVVGIGFQLLLVVIIARSLGPEQNGQYALALLLPTLMLTMLNFGIPSASVYFVARGRMTLRDAVRKSSTILLIAAPFGIAVGGVVIGFLGGSLFPGVPSAALILALVLGPLGLATLSLSGLIQSVQDFRGYNLVLLSPPLVSVVIVVPLALAGCISLHAVIAIWGVGQLGGMCVGFVYLRRHLRLGTGRSLETVTMRRFLRYGATAHASNVLTFLNYRMDIFLVSLLIGPVATGVYAVAVQLGERFWLVSHATAAVLFPRLSELDDDDAERRRLTPSASRWVTYLGVVAAAVLIPLAHPGIRLVFGQAYVASAAALLWLLPGLLAHNVTRIVANDLASRGRPDLNLYSSMVTFVVNLTGNLLLIPRYGVVGAAMATSLAYLTTTVMCLAFYHSVSGVRWWQTVLPRKHDLKVLRRAFERMRGTGSK